MTTLAAVRKRAIETMQLTCKMIGNVFQNISQETATTLRDGPDGWTALEVLCHLRDFDAIFQQRAQMILDEEYPKLPAYNQDELAIERNYNGENVEDVYRTLQESRQRFVAFFEGLTDEQWERAGVHPRVGHFTMTDAAMQVSYHDNLHLEQITRIVAAKS